jgi:hypothetical protein
MGQVLGFLIGYPDPRMGLEGEAHILPQRDALYGARLVGPLARSVVVVGHVCAQVRKGEHRFKVSHPELISSNNWAFCGTSYASNGPSSTVNPFFQKVITLIAVSNSRPAGAFWSGMAVDGVSSSPRRFPAPWKGPERASSSSNLRRDPLPKGA